ncbi:MAG: tripartite tricarboxylate transporter substrate binding protein [Burkholderiales bacterium]|nr:tripartite tricarboxylate transporter substrate binding protein [Burkholderiales bacterium]
MRLRTGWVTVRHGIGVATRVALAAIAMLALGAWPRHAAAADVYPSRPVRVIVGSPAGSSYDFMLRAMQEALRDELGQPIVIENRPGADQVLAVRQVAASAADGYTLLAGTRAQFVVNPVTLANPGYDADRDLAPITLLGYQTMLVAIDPVLPVRTLAELAAYSRARPNTLNYGASMGSLALAGEALRATISADLLQIPYNGIARSMNALLAGDVQVAIVDVTTAQASIRAGRVRALVVSGDRRFPGLPEVPTFAEAGYASADLPIWDALFAPAGTPEAIVARVRAAFVRVLGMPEIADKLAGAGIVPATTTPDALRAMILRERAEVGALVKRLGIAPQ